MDSDIAEKMKNILCPIHNKKIQFLNLELNPTLFFICADCLTKNKRYCMEKMDFFVSIEDFRNVYLLKMKKELDLIRDSIGTHVIHIDNHIKNGEVSIEDDFEKMIKTLTNYLKLILRGYKTNLTNKYREANKMNMRALENLKLQIDQMLDEGNGIISRLNITMNRQIENSTVLQTLLQEFLERKREYQDSVDQLKLLSTSFSFKDLICEYKMDEQKFEHLMKEMKDHLNAVFFKHLGSEDFREEVIQKSNKSIKEMKLESKNLFEAPDFDKLKKAKLSLVGAFQTSKHSSHHILAATNLNNSFLVTGHSDSTFKVWYLNPGYFQTPFSNPSVKTVTAKDLVEEDFAKAKKSSGPKPFELVFVSHTEEFHKHYVTALCSFDRTSDKRKILCSGDAGGELVVSEIAYHPVNAKLERVDVIFKRRSQNGQISKIDKFSNDDIIVTASFDGSMIFWDIEREQKLMHLTEHDEPIQSFQFMDDYNYLCSATKRDMVIWSITSEEKNGNASPGKKEDKSEEPASDQESKYLLKAKIVNSIDFESKGATFMTSKIFGTNLRYDYLLLVSVGSDIKLLNILKGKYIGDIDGAHFKGTTNFGIILNSGQNSKLKGTLGRVNQVLQSGNQKDLLNLFVEQLNDYLVLSCSSKDKLRVWKFDDAYSSPVAQASSLGGVLDSQIFVFNTRSGDVALLVCGSCSNKIEVFTLN